MKVLVIGAGVGGLAAAIVLARQGIDTTVVENDPPGTRLDVGLVLPGNALKALRELDVFEEVRDRGFPHDEMRFHDLDGTPVASLRSVLGGNVGISRQVLHDALHRKALSTGARISHTPVDPDHDRVLAFDGERSATRERLFGDHLTYTGYGAWRVVVPRVDEVENSMLYMGDGHRAGLIPLDAETMCLFHVSKEPEGQDLREKLRDYTGLVGKVRDDLPDDVVHSPINEVRLPSPWYQGNTLVAGDAAHAGAPHLMQGAAMALEDGIVAARLIHRPYEEFMRQRFERCRYVQERSRALLENQDTIDPQRMAATETVLSCPAW